MKRVKLYDAIYSIAEMLRLCLCVVLCVLLVNTFIFRKKTISGSSMYPTLQNEEHVLINVAASYLTSIERFDVVIVKSPFDDDELWVKRVIGLPNETIAYKDGLLYVNGEVVEETFLDQDYINQVMEENNLSVFTEDMEEVVLGDDEYFLVGDNRISSLDSRDERVQAFSRSSIIANGMLVYTPIQEMRYIK